jgi:hypothetical protein
MYNSKLIKSLRQLSGRELSRFASFLASPYFNKQQDNIAFFDWLRKFAPAFSHSHLAVDHLMNNWPLAGPMNKKKLSYIVSQLNRHLEQFLTLEQLADQPFTAYRLLWQKAASLEADHIQQRTEQKLRQFLQKQNYQNSRYYQQLYQLDLDDYLAGNPHSRAFNPKLQSVSNALDRFYTISRLQFAWQMGHLEAVSSEHYEHHFEALLLQWLETHELGQVPAIHVYRMGLKMLTEPEVVRHYFAFKSDLQEHGKLFPAAERKSLYTGLLNYCIRRSNQYGDLSFLEEFLQVNDLLMAEGLLLDEGLLSPWRYVNLKMAALRIGRDDWAWEFIHNYRQFLPDQYRDNVFNYALAHLYFYRKEYGQAQQILAQVQFEDLLFNVSLRTLLVRVYFEADEIETLGIPQLEANRLFLLRHKKELPEALYQQWSNFNKCCARLARMDLGDKTEKEVIRKRLEKMDQLLHREWLLEWLEKMT